MKFCMCYRIDSDLTVKVGDFGMTKELYIQDYYTSDTADYVPLRWMAPECITQGKFSIYSDVVRTGEGGRQGEGGGRQGGRIIIHLIQLIMFL